jgi:hypothetical protein
VYATDDQIANPDFWGFCRVVQKRIDYECAGVVSDTEMEVLCDRWLNPKQGVLERYKDDPLFALANPAAKQTFLETMTNTIRKAEREKDWLLLMGL